MITNFRRPFGIVVFSIISVAFASSVFGGAYQDAVIALQPDYYFQLNETDPSDGIVDTMGNVAPGILKGNYDGGAEIGIPGPDSILFDGAWTPDGWPEELVGLQIPLPGLGEGNTAHASNNVGHIDIGDSDLFGSPTMTVAMFVRGGPAQGGDRLFTNNLADPTRSFQMVVGNDGLVVSVDPSDECADEATCKHRSLFLPDMATPLTNQGVDRGMNNADNGWWHVIASTTGSNGQERAENIRVWINGLERTEDMAPGTTGWGRDTNTAKIGGRRADPADSTTHSGAQDEVAIWLQREAFTEVEAQTLFNAAVSPDAGGPGPRGVQISSIDFNSGTIELTNFDSAAHDLSNWRLCSHDDDEQRVYSSGLGGSIEPGATRSIDIGSVTVALPFDSDAYSLSLFDLNGGGFGGTDNMIDHIQWSTDGADNTSARIRTGQAVTAGLWTNEDNFIATSAESSGIQLIDTTGGILHSSGNYSVIAMPGLNCDFDGNGSCELADIDSLLAAVGSADAQFDIDNNGAVDRDDIGAWLESAGNENQGRPYLDGDANLDGVVDASDLNDVGLNWQSAATSWADGDFNGDGTVDATDLNSIGLNWQQGAAASASQAAVPEPSGMTLVLGGLLLMLGRRHK